METKTRDRLFVGGTWVPTSSRDMIDLVSPATEQIIGSVACAAPADVDRAVAAARATFDGSSWRDTSLEDRVGILERLAALYVERRDEVANLITTEMGCPITLSRTMQATSPRMLIKEFVAAARSFPFSELHSSATGNALVEHEPVGVVAAVIPWNSPHSSAILKLAPAILTGCTVILKPAPETALDALLLADMFSEAGVPAGVLSVLPADREVSEYLISHPGVDKVAFTGSTAAGRRIAALCGRDLRRVTLELGGKSAAIILDDADLDLAVESLRGGALRNSGQVCTLKTRVLVPRHLQVEVVERMAAAMDSMPLGDPFDGATEVGPLVSSRQRDRVQGYIEIGQAEGARIVRGGRPPEGLERGWYVDKTLFSDVDNGMRIAQEEIFGPVVCVIPYDDDEDAITKANQSEYGLSGAVFTPDRDRGLGIARRIRTGMIELNDAPTGLSAPFGGMKASGIGREMGVEGLRSYTEIKSIGVPRDLVPRT